MAESKDKKRILMLNYEFPPLGGGASPVSYEIAKRLSETEGYSIDVVTMGFKGLPSYEEINPDLRIHRVWSFRRKKQISYPWEQLIYLITGLFKARKLFKKGGYSKIYTHFIIPSGALAYVLKKLYKVEYVITAHGSDVIGYNPRFDKLYPVLIRPWKKIIDEAETITAPSQYLCDMIQKTYAKPNNKIKWIVNGINKDKFYPMEKEKYILTVCRMVFPKGVQDLITALQKIDFDGWKLKVVGEGPYLETLQNLAVELKVQDKVDFLGWVDNKSEQMKELYGKASIFCLPSHFENMSVTLMESMQSGCCTVAADVGGNKEVIGDAGVLFEAKNPESIAVALNGLLKDPNRISALGKAGEKRLNSSFVWDVILDDYVALLS